MSQPTEFWTTLSANLLVLVIGSVLDNMFEPGMFLRTFPHAPFEG